MCLLVGISFIVTAIILGALVLWDYVNSLTDGEPDNENLEEN